LVAAPQRALQVQPLGAGAFGFAAEPAEGIARGSQTPETLDEVKGKTDTAVTLVTADGRIVEVPVARLSDGDKSYLASLEMPADNPFAGGVPLEGMTDLVPQLGGTPAADAPQPGREPVEFPANTLADLQEQASVGPALALPGTGTTIDVSVAAGDQVTVGEDPWPEMDPVPAGVATLPPTDAYDKIGGPVRLADDHFVVSIGRNKSGSPEETRGRLVVVGLQTGTATLVPFTADLEIRSGADVLWQRSSTNHVPTLLRLEEGETVQDAVKRYEKPDPAFFGRLNLPPRIPRPEVAAQIGMSSLKDGQWMDIPASIRNRNRPRQ